jgi:hypothetical protein
MIEVYHLLRDGFPAPKGQHNEDYMALTFGERAPTMIELADPNKFKWVANVETDSMDDAFCWTNNITHSWTSNLEIEAYAAGPQRSTSVGDVFITGSDTDDEVAYAVANSGFSLI